MVNSGEGGPAKANLSDALLGVARWTAILLGTAGRAAGLFSA